MGEYIILIRLQTLQKYIKWVEYIFHHFIHKSALEPTSIYNDDIFVDVSGSQSVKEKENNFKDKYRLSICICVCIIK